MNPPKVLGAECSSQLARGKMKTREVVLCVLNVLVFVAVRTESLSCPEQGYPPNICLTFSTDTQSAATTNCASQLVNIEDSEHYNTLSRYVEVLQNGGSNYWIGYRYNSSNVLVDYSDNVPNGQSPVSDSSNFASSSQASETDGTCLAIGVSADDNDEVRLFRVDCTTMLAYICAETILAPSEPTLSPRGRQPLAQGGNITITCSLSNTDGPPEWRRDNEVVTSETSGLTISDTAGTLTVDSFDGEVALYECVGRNNNFSAVSELVAVGMDDSGAFPTASISSSTTSAQFGTAVTLTCSFTSPDSSLDISVEWFIDGDLIQTDSLSGSETESMFMLESFSEDGVYQCRVVVDNYSSVGSVFISGRAGTPGVVDVPIALADTQSQVFVSWLHPLQLNGSSPLLLRYNVYYQEGTDFNVSTASMVPDVLPTLLDGDVSDNGVVEVVLTGLSIGTRYTVSVRAVSSAGEGVLGDVAIVSTYGNAPTVTVDDTLKAQRTQDNKTLFADWDDFKTEPPTGQPARYWVEYRDSGKEDAINSVILDIKYSYLVVFPIQDAQNYEVRVRVGVITNRQPLTYEYGPYSKWVEVEGIVATVPPAPPTGQLGPAAGVIAAAVVVPVLVITLIVFIVVFGIICFCVKRSGKSDNYSQRTRLDSQAASLQPKTPVEKELDPVL